MSQGARRLRKVALSALHYSGADSMIAPFTRGVGAILTLHQVSPDKPGAFEPNRDLKVTPRLHRAGHPAGARGRLRDRVARRGALPPDRGRVRPAIRLLCLRRRLSRPVEHAYPIFQRYDLPFAFYVATDYPSGHGELWWLALERVIIKVGALDVKIDGSQRRLRCGSPAEKEASYQKLYGWLQVDRRERRARVRARAVRRASTSISPGSAQI